MMTAEKTKTRRSGRVFVNNPKPSLLSTANHGNRFSPFGCIVSDGRTLRELESDAFVERWLESERGALFLIGRYFAQVEADFFAVRAAANEKPDPYPGDFYDVLMLDIHRREMARKLMVRARPEYQQIINERAELPCPLPPLPTRPMTELERKVERRLKERAGELIVVA